MKKTIFFLILITSIGLKAQSFIIKTNKITQTIDSITIAEKKSLKEEIIKIDKKLKNKEIDYQTAETEKEKLANLFAEKIEKSINQQKQNLDKLISDRVDEHIAGNFHDTIKLNRDTLNISINIPKKSKKKNKYNNRTTSEIIFAVGVNTLLSKDDNINDKLNLFSSRFWEYGFNWNTRLLNDSNLTHIKYGFSLLYNNYRPKDNYVFVADKKEPILKKSDIDLDLNKFRNLYVNIPIHLEFDLSPKIYHPGESYRFGLGGYAGFLISSAHFTEYKTDSKTVTSKTIDNFNVNDFNYGLSSYIGYESFSIYAKYDLQSMFKHNQQNNLSIGLRWDFR